MPKYPSLLLTNSLGFPRFSTLEELSQLTRLSTRLLYCLSKNTEQYYHTKFIDKRSGGKRELSIPSYSLGIVQRWILVNILSKVTPTAQAMAFQKGSSFGTKQNAWRHANHMYGLSIDLQDFFPSITAAQVRTVFSSLGYNGLAAAILTKLCTLDGELPQGSPCSPALSNLVCITLDHRLVGLCEKRGIVYTRYADDMYFSCDDKTLLLRYAPVIRDIITDEGFTPHPNKQHFHTPANRKRITGINVVQNPTSRGTELKAPREMKRQIRAEIFRCIMTGDYSARSRILGRIAYVRHVEAENSRDYESSIRDYIEKTADKIRYFPELVKAYNDNRFFKDMHSKRSAAVKPRNHTEMDSFTELYSQRCAYLNKNGLTDICSYDKWPSELTTDR